MSLYSHDSSLHEIRDLLDNPHIAQIATAEAMIESVAAELEEYQRFVPKLREENKRLKELIQKGCDAWYEDSGWEPMAKWVRKAEQALTGE